MWEGRYYHNNDDFDEWAKNRAKKRCTCGAIFTDNPTMHVEYCDCFVKDYFETDSERRKGNANADKPDKKESN